MEHYQQILNLWQSFRIKTTSDLEKYLDSFRILFAYNSGKLENDEITYHDTRDIFENGRVSGFTGNPRALFETMNQKLCYQYLVPKIVAKKALSKEFVLEVHGILTGGTYNERLYLTNQERPGTFKKHEYVVGMRQVGVAASEVEKELEALLEEVNGYQGDLILKIGAYLHAGFEHIHPFADGNGRVGRSIMNYYLMIHNHPPVIIYEEDRRSYYEALRIYDDNGELEPLCQFLMQETERTWGKALDLSQKRVSRDKNEMD